MSRFEQISIEEAIKHPIATLLRIFNLQRIGPSPSPPQKDHDSFGFGATSEDGDPFDRPSQALADILKRRGHLNRIEKYAIYEEMDRDPLCSEVLNAYAEAATQINYHKGVIVWTEAKNSDIQQINDNMLKRVGYQESAFARARDLIKYGDVFDGLVYMPDKEGIVALKPYDPWKVARIQDEYFRLMGFSPADSNGLPTNISEDAVPPYDISHMRLLSKDRRMHYGTGLFDSSWEKYEDLQAMEDSVVLARLLRRPDRLMVLLDTTGLSLPQSFEAVKRYEKWLYKEIHVKRGESFQSRGIPLAENRDLIFPKGPNNATEITNFPASANNDLLRDLEMVMSRFLGSLGMPRGYFGIEGGDYRPDASLAKQDVRFAKKAMRLQYMFLLGTVHIGRINQALRGLDPDREVNFFENHGMPISTFMEIEYNELLQMRFDLVDRMGRTSDDMGLNKDLWVRYVLEEIGKLPKDFIDKLLERTEGNVDEGRDREIQAALEELPADVERALLIDEAKRSCKASSKDVSTMEPTKMKTLIERYSQEDLKLVEAAAKESEWEEKILHEAPGVAAFERSKIQLAEDRVERLRLLTQTGGRF